MSSFWDKHGDREDKEDFRDEIYSNWGRKGKSTNLGGIYKAIQIERRKINRKFYTTTKH